MGSLSIKGKIFHPPGLWGLNKPVAGASIKIEDLDLPGRQNDVIWQGSTDSNGNFQGTTSDWQDRITVTPATHFTPAITIADPTDIMLLQITISQNTPTGTKQITAPFVWLGNNLPSPPMLVTWGPPDAVVKINGHECYTRQDIESNTTTAINSGSPLTIQVYGPDALLLQPLTLPTDQLRNWIKQRYSGSVNGLLDGIPFPTPPDWAVGVFVILVGVGILCLAIGASVILVCLGIAVIYAVSQHYKNISVHQKTDASTGQNYIEFEITK